MATCFHQLCLNEATEKGVPHSLSSELRSLGNAWELDSLEVCLPFTGRHIVWCYGNTRLTISARNSRSGAKPRAARRAAAGSAAAGAAGK